MLGKIGQFLQTRFPEKLVLTEDHYHELVNLVKGAHTELAGLHDKIREMDSLVAKAYERLSVLETSAVHKDAVQAVVKHLQEAKEEVNKIKFSMGIDRQVNPEIQAMLNGKVLGEQNG